MTEKTKIGIRPKVKKVKARKIFWRDDHPYLQQCREILNIVIQKTPESYQEIKQQLIMGRDICRKKQVEELEREDSQIQ